MSDGVFVRVRDVMQEGALEIDGMATVRDALALMRSKNISSLVVPRRDERDEYGLVKITDLAREVIARDRSPARTSVYEVMVKPAPALDAEMNIKYAVSFMHRFGLTHAIVVENRQLVGIVTIRDMVLRYVEEAGEI